MKISQHGLDLLKEWEGCRCQVYKDAGGRATIGVGHLLTREEIVGGKFDDGITDEEAINLLTADVGPVERTVNDAVTFPLDQFEFDALVIFAFNVGCGAFRKSTLLKRLNSGNFLLVPYELRKWVRVNGKRCAGLANRREKEIQLWSGNI